jgi:hypothetical protein
MGCQYPHAIHCSTAEEALKALNRVLTDACLELDAI